MADNPTLPLTGSGDATAVVATDDIAGIHYQRVKLIQGADGTNDGDVATGNPLPVADQEKVADNAAFVDGTTPVQPMGGILDEVAGVALTENDIAAPRIDSKRALVLTVEDEATRGQRLTVTAANAAKVDGSAVIQPVSAASLPLPAGAATAAAQLADGHNVTVDNAAGASAVNIQDGGNVITVDGTVNVDLNAGTNTNEVVGDVAADAAAAGNPVGVGGQAETMADAAPGTRVSADGDAVRMAADRDGAVYTHPHGPQTWSYHENSSSALTDATVHAAPGAGLSLYVTDIVVSTGAATAFNVFFEEGASAVLGPYYLEAIAGRGFSVHFQTPKKITANTALTVTTSAAIAHGIDVTGFIAPG